MLVAGFVVEVRVVEVREHSLLQLPLPLCLLLPVSLRSAQHMQRVLVMAGFCEVICNRLTASEACRCAAYVLSTQRQAWCAFAQRTLLMAPFGHMCMLGPSRWVACILCCVARLRFWGSCSLRPLAGGTLRPFVAWSCCTKQASVPVPFMECVSCFSAVCVICLKGCCC